MDEHKLHTDIEVLKERVSNLFTQINRFISHLESEQRVTGNISKRVDTLQHELDRVQKTLDEGKETHKWRLDTFIAIVSVISTIVLGLMMLLNK